MRDFGGSIARGGGRRRENEPATAGGFEHVDGAAPHSGVDELTEVFLSSGALPAKAKADAVHLAVATSHRVDYLLTWNCKHLANAEILLRLRPLAEQCGYRMPEVCRPLQLMGEIEYED